jgi:DNA-binding beta-propeller fold protein YncE
MSRLVLCVVGIVIATFLAAFATACGGGSTAAASSSPTVGAAVVTTVAGQAGSAGSVDGSGAAARFDSPEGIVCDAAGDLYVADAHNCTIRKVTPAGEVTTVAGKSRAEGSADGRGTAARFYAPSGITRDAAGNLYVTCYLDFTIRKITPAGEVTTLAGKAGVAGSADGKGAAARFSNPLGIICDATGDLYVTDDNADTIRKITPAGEVTTVAGKAGSAGSDDGKGAAARFNDPAGMTFDAAGNLYVADYLNGTIREITPAGEVTTVATAGGAAARFAGPTGIVFDSAGDLYIAEMDGDTISRLTAAGELTSLAGKNLSPGSADGSGATARFDGPAAIARDAAGDLYVSDYSSDTIRKIDLTGSLN